MSVNLEMSSQFIKYEKDLKSFFFCDKSFYRDDNGCINVNYLQYFSPHLVLIVFLDISKKIVLFHNLNEEI